MENSDSSKPKAPHISIETIMTAEVLSIHVSMTVREAIEVLTKNKISGAPVVDSNQQVVSVVSEGSLLKVATHGGVQQTIANCLKQLPSFDDLITLGRTDSFQDAYKIFLGHSVHRIIVIDGNRKLQGIVSRSNILRMLVAQAA